MTACPERDRAITFHSELSNKHLCINFHLRILFTLISFLKIFVAFILYVLWQPEVFALRLVCRVEAADLENDRSIFLYIIKYLKVHITMSLRKWERKSVHFIDQEAGAVQLFR